MIINLEKTLQTPSKYNKKNTKLKNTGHSHKLLKDMLPTRQLEAWKYTDLANIYQKFLINCVKTREENNYNKLLGELNLSGEAHYFVFINGILARADQHPSIVFDKTLPAFDLHEDIKHSTMCLAQERAIAGFHLQIKEQVILEQPIHIYYVQSDNSDQKVVNYQNFIELSLGSRCQIYENFISTSDQYSAININTKVNLAENSHYCYDYVSNKQQRNLVLTNAITATLSKYAQFDNFHLSGDSALTRFDFIIDLIAQGAVFNGKGGCVISDNSHSDYHFYINHLASNTSSKIDFRSIAGGQSTVVFNANGHAIQGVKNVQILQNNRNIQLTDHAKINTKPELEIYSDGSVCTHAATIGALDPKALLYLQARGVSYEKSTQLLLEGFIKAIITKLKKPSKTIYSYLKILKEKLLALKPLPPKS